MKNVGETAMEKIYISWEDSVQKATERYKIVLENYRNGKYEKEQTFEDEWLGTEGEILDIICKAKSRGKNIKNEFESYGKTAFNSSLRAAKSFNRRRIKLKNSAREKQNKIKKAIKKRLEKYF